MDKYFVSVTLASSAETLARECAGIVLAGRSDECQIHLAHPLVSRRHASIELLDGQTYRVTDLNSRNGTTVDGVPLRDASAQASNGSLIQIGPFTLTLTNSGWSAEETVQAPRMPSKQHLELDRDLRQLLMDGKVFVDRLSPQETKFIDVLIKATPGLVPTGTVGDAIWGSGQWDVYMLHNLVRRIRKKLEDRNIDPETIENIPGSGYRLV